jgi:hypothetical protein
MSKKKTICIDFDGVLHDYSDGYQGKDVFGEMIPNADKGTQLLKSKGWTIIIYTTRQASEKLKSWLEDHKIAYDHINENPEQPEDAKGGKLIADIYLDDRGMRFNGRWDEWLMGEIAGFKPWQQNQKDNMEKRYDEAAAWANDDEPDIWTKGDIKRICHT